MENWACVCLNRIDTSREEQSSEYLSFLFNHSDFLFFFKTSVNKDTLLKNPNLLLEYVNIRER